MTFFNTFSEISKNKDNFKQWEQDKADQQAKREKYFAQNPISEQQKKQAKEFGRVVVDTVDFMDAQSENKSESVEMASEMTTGITSAIAFAATFVGLAKNHGNKAKKLSDTNSKLSQLAFELKEDNPEHMAIIEDLKEHRLARENKKFKFLSLSFSLDGYYNIYDKKKFDKLSDKTKEYFKEAVNEASMKNAKTLKGGVLRTIAIPALVSLGIGTVGQVFGTMLQIKASRVARYQAREELKDTKNFVEYTDEQKEEAKKYIAGINIPKEKKSGSIKDIRSVMKDYGNYQAESEKLNNTHFYNLEEANPEEAYRKQKVINTSIKKINNKAEEYAENMETSAGVLFGCSVLGGALFGKIADFIIKKSDRAKKSAMEKARFAGKKVVEETEDNLDEVKKVGFFKRLKKTIGEVAKKSPGTFGAILSAIITIPIATKITKEASRAGRYKAKRELEEKPENFIYVDKEQLASIDAQGEVKKDSVVDVIKFIPESIKTIREYEKYKKTTLREKKAELEALKMTKISDEQMKNAANLQARLYKSFDVIDDHSEQYSEHMEAACEIVKDTFNGLVIPAALAAPGIYLLKKPQKVFKPMSGFVAGVLKNYKGFAKKYASNMGEHSVNKQINKIKRSWEYEQISFVEKDIDEILSSTDKASHESKMNALKQKMETKLSKYSVERYMEQVEKFKNNDFSINFEEKMLEKVDPKDISENPFVKGALDDVITQLDNIKDPKVMREHMKNFVGDMIDFNKLSDNEVMKIKDNTKSILENLPKEEIAKSYLDIAKFGNQRTMKNMVLANNKDLALSPREFFVTKDANPIVYTVVGAYAAAMIGLSYFVESYLSSKTKQAGRLGTMKAIEELNAENDKALEMSKSKK